MALKYIGTLVVLLVVGLVGTYASLLIIEAWPINNFSIDRAGLFGDSFGVLNSLFSGLAFAGIIITILLQREELKLQRKEMIRSSTAQEQSTRLLALTQLLAHYKEEIAINSDTINRMFSSITEEQLKSLNQKCDTYMVKRDTVLNELETLIALQKIQQNLGEK